MIRYTELLVSVISGIIATVVGILVFIFLTELFGGSWHGTQMGMYLIFMMVFLNAWVTFKGIENSELQRRIIRRSR